ncbi:patatin-like phospholipase family protein [Gloeothece verrucosa]|uniref:Patatin n=1 Tax=Gloeothece verrucosa (strain PCC 7822) TaxID=497965 RepID=E0U7M4_GLOV7|nr:patatin-like phospholipase family protein [Gloeothece verrucosa]ADN14836.1 Patatin [Gloeothece verrucosa PCC 7822]
MKPKIAIACQGGGSQTAFTAGVLKALFENKVQDYFNIVSLSGTSGGAICAFLIWYSLKKGDEIIWKRMIDFWQDNSAQTYQERFFNDFVIKSLEWVSKGLLPQYALSPYSPAAKIWFSFATQGLRSRFTDLKELLETHIDFSELKTWGPQLEAPILVLGSCNIITGKLHKFVSRLESIKVEHLLASACVPNIFPAVSIEEMAYWDGLFSDNPPIRSLIRPKFVGLENIPQEIWVIKINPTATDKIPEKPDDIADRRNEVEGNVSLFQSLDQVELINDLFLRNAFKDEFLAETELREPIKIPKSFADDPDRDYYIPMIEMSKELADSLNYESKLDRCPESLKRLIDDGEKQGKLFLETRLRQLDLR